MSKKLILNCCLARLYNSEKCRCRSIHLIQNNWKKCVTRLHQLPSFESNKTILNYGSINSFVLSSKENNDSQNKLRESIIVAVVNKNIPKEYLLYSKRWYNLQQSVMNYLHKITPIHIDTISCVPKAGRRYNYDFDFIINNENYKVELKFNATKIDDTPQYNSPMKPSQYMTKSYEEYFFDNYLSSIASKGKLVIPEKSIYLKEIHNNEPPCMKEYKTLYKTDSSFYETCKEQSKKSIENFMDNVELKTELLSSYLLESQKNKHYMMFSKNIFYYQQPNMDDYIINSYTVDQKNKNRFICQTKSGKEMKILLRWKNGNGIAYPAFQIS